MRRPPRSPLLPSTPLCGSPALGYAVGAGLWIAQRVLEAFLDRRARAADVRAAVGLRFASMLGRVWVIGLGILAVGLDRKSTRLNSSHANISSAVFCLIKKA